MKKRRGSSKKKWLCSAVTSMPCSSKADMTGLTSSCKRTRSPMRTSSPPSPLVMATQPPKPNGVGAEFPAKLTCRSFRGTLTLRTFALKSPVRPKNLSNGAQSNTLWRDMLLPFNVCPPDDQCEAVKRRVREFIIIENGLKGTALSPVVQLHFGKPGCVEGRRFLLPSGVEELVFGYEAEHGLRVNESSNEPGTSNPIHFHVAASNPFHALFLMWFL